MTNNQRKLDAYRAANIECARIIIADPGRYAGVMTEWAHMVLAKEDEGRMAGASPQEERPAA